jgi:hypothetical protein
MTLFAESGAGGGRRKRSSSLRAKTNEAKKAAAAAADAKKTATLPPAGPLQLSPTAQKLFDDIDNQWQLSPPVRQLLRIAAEAMTKAEHADAIVQAAGMTIADAKGAAKPHPAAVLAHNSRTLAATTLQRVLASLGG